MAQRLWAKLEKRSSREEYKSSPCGMGSCLAGRRCVVVGAGPIGLRCAIELRLLGANVAVVEQRTSFTRINQLHLWQWCADEIQELGARCLEPPGLNFATDGDRLNMSIADLQTLLLKTALLLGAEVFLGTEFKGAEFEQSTSSWYVRLARWEKRDRNLPSPEPPSMLRDVAVLIGSDGINCKVGQDLGIARSDMSCLKSDAIGLVFNMRALPAGSREKVRPFKMAKHFYLNLFQEARRQTGLDLENIVYMRDGSSHTNYHVATPTKECLGFLRILKDTTKQPLLDDSNVDRVKLDEAAWKLATFKFCEHQPSLAEVAKDAGVEMEYADRGPMLFDFSTLRRAHDGIKFCQASGETDDMNSLIVAVVGDALLEPFWPEGLGIIRGFMSVLDFCSALQKWALGTPKEVVLSDFARSFTQLKLLAAASRSSTLRADEKGYRLDPRTRYKFL